MKRSRLIGNAMLLVAALLWGTTFVAQSEGMDHMGPLTYQALRSILGGLFLLPIIALSTSFKKKHKLYTPPSREEKKKTFLVGVLCGIVLTVAALLQQYGIALGTESDKAGFITALYIVLVPIFGLFLKKRVHPTVWAAVAIAVFGLYFLCIQGDFSVLPCDMVTLCCAVVFALHIITIDNLAIKLNGVAISTIQFFTSAVISGIGMLIFESPSLSSILSGWVSVAYAGILSSGVAYTLQILGQQRTDPTVASILMSLESLFAVLGTIVFTAAMGAPSLPTAREWIGCALMFCAIILTQLPDILKRRADA
ncbi:MAG: DMT family transporter [Ruminococcaceae bacterium]|nr:DMT family transporter [Oscillospiraceae bacterium]